MHVLIIGLGSPFGDDRLGWVVAEMLRHLPAVQSASGSISVSVLDRPGAMLVARWRGADAAILVDAVRSGAPPGTLHRLDAGDIAVGRTLSSHGFGVAAALELGWALGELPARICLHGIEMDPDHAGAALSPAVQAALPALVGRIERQVARLVGAAVPGVASQYQRG